MSFEAEASRIRHIIGHFPETFGLRKFPGEQFSISESASMFCGDNLIYIQNAVGQPLFKDTPENLRRQIVKVDIKEWKLVRTFWDEKEAVEYAKEMAEDAYDGTRAQVRYNRAADREFGPAYEVWKLKS